MSKTEDPQNLQISGSPGPIQRRSEMVMRGLNLLETEQAEKHATGGVISIKNIKGLAEIKEMGEGAIFHQAASPDGSLIVVSAARGIYVHEGRAFSRIAHLPKQDGSVCCLDVTASGRRVAMGFHSGELGIWEFESGNEVSRFQAAPGHINLVRFTPDGEILVVCNVIRVREGQIRVFDAKNLSLIAESEEIQEMVIEMVISPDGAIVITLPYFGPPIILDLQDLSVIRNMREHRVMFGLQSIEISDDGSELRSVGDYWTASDLRTGKVLETGAIWDEGPQPEWVGDAFRKSNRVKSMKQALEIYTPAVNCLAFSPDSSMLASGGEDHRLRLWDISSGLLARSINMPKESESSDDEPPEPVHSLAYSPDGRTIAVGRAHEFSMVDLETGVIGTSIAVDSRWVSGPDPRVAVDISHDGDMLVAAGKSEPRIAAYKLPGFQKLWEYEFDPKFSIRDVRIAPNGTLIAVALGLCEIHSDVTHEFVTNELIDRVPVAIFSASTGEILAELPPDGRSQPPKFSTIWGSASVVFSSDATLLASDDEYGAYIYFLEDTPRFGKSIDHEDRGYLPGRSALSIDDRLWFVGDSIIDIDRGDRIKKIEGHLVGRVKCVAISSDGSLLATGGYNGIIRIWAVSAEAPAHG